jgi:carotenoid cleavage dioxygenase-like enzyme
MPVETVYVPEHRPAGEVPMSASTDIRAKESERNPYLEGVFAPVAEEVVVRDLAILEGEVPRDLHGVYVRIGPNPRHAPLGRYHWFDGDGMVHGVHFADGKVTYRNRWVRTEGFRREEAAGRALWRGIMERAVDNPVDMPEKDTANTDLAFHRGQLLALWYRCGVPHALDPITLETLRIEDFGGTLRRRVSAHARADEATGELMIFDYGSEPPYMHYGIVGTDGRVQHCVPIDLPGPRLPHEIAITEHHSILMDLPLFNDPEAARRGRHRIVFDRSLPARFGVIPRRGQPGEVRWFEAEPCYIYHSINAWEGDGTIVLDACRVLEPQPAVTGAGPLAQMLTYLRLDAHVHRYRFDLRTGRTHEERLDDANVEFPAINRRYTGRRARFGYTMRISSEPTLRFDGITRYDLEGGTARTYRFGPGRWGSEVGVAPRVGARAEDDGYVVSFVRDEGADSTEVVVLDAAEIERGPVVRLRLPVQVPLGFHANWIPGERLPHGGV